MATIIREATIEDAPGIARAHVDSWRTTYPGIVRAEFIASLTYEKREAAFREQLTAGGQRVTFVAEVDGVIVGFASGGQERENDPVYRGELYGIYLLKEHQRRGIGRRLVAAIAERLLQAGFTNMLVRVLAANPARAFYERLGARPVREKTITIGGDPLPEVEYGWDDIRPLAGGALGGVPF